MATWRSGYAGVCKTPYTGSIPVVASNMKKSLKQSKISVLPWSVQEFRLHREAVRRLENILSAATKKIARGARLTEETLAQFMVERMRKQSLTSVLNWVIVAYGPSAANPHYRFTTGKSRLIKPGQLLLLDIWGKLNRPDAPYADLTHMYFVGARPSNRVQELWTAVRDSRNKALQELTHNHKAHGADLHTLATNHLDKCGHQGRFIHGLGHDLGHDHPHGPGVNLSPKFPQSLVLGRGYTIEPGIYKPGAYGVRSEIDVFLALNGRLTATCQVQQTLPCLG